MTALDRAILDDRLARLDENLRLLQTLSSLSKQDLLDDPLRRHALLHALQWAIEAGIDAGNHLVARLNLGVPQDYAQVFERLVAGGVLSPPIGEEWKKLARLRNRIVHVYWNVDWDEILSIVRRLDFFTAMVADIRRYLAAH